MSNKILNRVWEDKTIKTARDRLALLALADQANDDGICWPGLKSIERRMNCSRPTATKAINKLEHLGVICVFESIGRAGRRSNHYIVKVGMSDEELKRAIDQIIDKLGNIEAREPKELKEVGKPVFTGGVSKPVFTGVSKPVFTGMVNPYLHDPIDNPQNDPQSNAHHEIPENLQTPEFLEVWDRWKQYRKEIRKTMKQTTMTLQLKQASQYSPEEAIWVMNQSMMNGWTGLFWNKLEDRKKQNGSNGVNKQDLLTEIETAVSTYGHTRYTLAMETMSQQAKETVAKMGKWAYVCSLPAKQLQVEFYRACNS